MKTLHILTLGLLIVSLTACNLPGSPPLEPVALGKAEPQTWVDAPLDQMHLPLAPYEIVFHASDDSAITQVGLQINDQEVAVPPLSETDKKLVTVKYVWAPSVPGEYVLRARSQNLDGAWSDEAVVTVWIGDLTPTVTNTPITTTSPTATITPTLSPTVTASPTATQTPSPAALTFTHSISANEFHYGRCDPTSIDIQVAVNGGDVDSVVLFVKLNDQSGSGTTGWISYNAMKPMGNGQYKITVASSRIEGSNKYGSAWMVYQFVATKNKAVVGRSASFQDVVLTACSVSPLLPAPPLLVVPLVPSNTPEIIK
jgi:hypothetical protein